MFGISDGKNLIAKTTKNQVFRVAYAIAYAKQIDLIIVDNFGRLICEIRPLICN